MTVIPSRGLQLRSLVREDGRLQLSLEEVPVPDPGPDEVLVRVEASPINPSDLGQLLAGADLSTLEVAGSPERPILTAEIPATVMPSLAGRVGQSLPVGNEGAGTVVRAGSSEPAQALIGRVVAMIGGSMYSEYQCLAISRCLALAEGTVAAAGASAYVNPLTALGMVETMRLEKHRGLVHTAAASNVGQMLNRVCLTDRVPLVNIVRRREQVELLRAAGAEHVCDSSDAGFMDNLTAAIAATSATLAFDATGEGTLASQILAAMERAVSAGGPYSRYGSTVRKQVYIYGGLDRGPTELSRTYGMAWGVGGWLVFPTMERIGGQAAARLRQRVASELTTTFATSYAREISLAEALSRDAIAVYSSQAMGAKYLINPSR
jgi:NADPH2:quinone reductase